MKNITQYFVDTAKSSENVAIPSNSDAIKESDSKRTSNGKRNRVKIKISRRNAQERVCDIVDSNNDMIDKTPSPFASKVSKVDKNSNETPKRSSLSNLPSRAKDKKLQDRNLDYLSLERNDVFNRESNKQNRKNSSGNSPGKGNKYKRESRSGKKVSSTNLNNKYNDEEDIEFIDIADSDSNGKNKSSSEESNAFQILMSRNKPAQQVSPTKTSPQNEEMNARKSEEYREKLKRSKERLIALADKKGYSKRKLAEIEEGEKIEQMIQNRVEVFKMKGRKDDDMNTTVLDQKQSSGSLLNYFSKAPVDVMHTSTKDMSTIVVKADVHVSENSVKQSFLGSDSKNRIRPTKKDRSNLKFPEVDNISIVGSENISISHNKQDSNKHKWSLRIKLQTYENESSLSAYSSDEEIFSPRSKAKLGVENDKSKIPKRPSPENVSVTNKSKGRTSKQVNEHSKLKLRKQEQENSKDDIKIQNDERLGTESNNKNNAIKLEKRRSISVHNKGIDNCVSVNLRNAKQVQSNQEDCTIISNDNLKRKTSDKLAPLFIKRPKPDPETIAARRLFLQSDIVDNKNNNKSIDHKINVCNTLPFPIISHVTQLNNSNCNKMNSFNILEKVSDQYVPRFNVKNYKFIIDFSEIKSRPLKNINKPKIENVLTEIEKNCSDVRKIWDTISLVVKEYSNNAVSPKARTKRGKQAEKREIAEYKNKNQIENCWTYKYRPKRTEEVVGNEEAATKLKEWLTGWRATFTNEDVSSSDEFYSTDCSSDTRTNENNQVAVLLGPCGSGKTASVYAVAEEFGFTVLEVNASSKRSGKKLLKEFEEATKSHRIRKENNPSAFFNSASDEVVPKKIPQNSLILIEDVDVIFEEDEGFVSATYQLASNTKRPIVMTCRDVYPHLSKMAPQQNRIYFQSALGSRVFALLELISLAETGYRLPQNCIMELLQSGDIRKAILQLQYLLLSGPTQEVDHPINFKNSFWQNMRHYLYKPAIKVSKRQKSRKSVNNKVGNNKQDILNDVAKKLDSIALLSSLIDVDDSALNLRQIKMQPSLSLTENTSLYSVSNNICSDIAEWISKKIVFKDHSHEYERSQYQINLALKTQLNKGVNAALSQATSLLLDRQIVSTDYLPSVRAICRAEESRANINNKRGNRFFHYLHSSKVPSTSLKPNILAAACKIMHDKTDNDTSKSENSTINFV